MAKTIPADEQVFMVSKSTNTTYSGSAALKAMNEWYTMEDVANTVQPYKVFTALLTQSGGDGGGSYVYDGALTTIGVTYIINYNDDGLADFTNIGAPNNNVGTKFIATGTTPANWGTYAELEYNTGAPVATVLENTIGNVWFTYGNFGIYYVISNALFTENKTYITVNGQSRNMDGNPAFIYSGYFGSTDTIFLQTLVPDMPNTFSNDALYNTPIEIRVYN